jgi:hypothetical protein
MIGDDIIYIICDYWFYYPILYIYLVGGLEHFLVFHIQEIVTPTDELIFFRGVYHQADIFLLEMIRIHRNVPINQPDPASRMD